MSPRTVHTKIVAAIGLSVALLACAHSACASKKDTDTAKLRAEYVSRLEQQYTATTDTHTLGSLWSDQGSMNDISSDYKAFRLNDTVTILVAVQTTAAQSGTVDSERTFATNSAVTGVLGKAPSVTNPLLSANSSSALKGQGSTASNTTFTTSLTGQVVAVLPNGALIVEAERKVFMNNQHERRHRARHDPARRHRPGKYRSVHVSQQSRDRDEGQGHHL